MLRETGFQVEVLHCHQVKRYIGLRLGAGGSQWLPVLDKLALIDTAREELTSSETVWPHEVRSVVAHFVHFGLLWRPSLSVLHTIFAFCRQGSPWRVP